MTQTYRAALAAFAIAGAAALCGSAAAQEDPGLVAANTGEAQVIGVGDFVTNGRNTRLKVNGTYHQLCTTLPNNQEKCMNIVASRTMDGIKVSTKTGLDGTALIDFIFDPKSTRHPIYMTYAVARFRARFILVSEALEYFSTNATAPDTGEAATNKCGGNSKLAADTSSDSGSCDTGPGGGGGSTGNPVVDGGRGTDGPTDIPSAGPPVIITAYRLPDPPPPPPKAPPVDIHADPITPPTASEIGGVPVVVVPAPHKDDAPLITPVPRLDLPPANLAVAHLWDGCIQIVTPIGAGMTCANVGRRDPNRIPPVVHTPPPLPTPTINMTWESLKNWWGQWWPFPQLDWCKLIGYGCVAKGSSDDPLDTTPIPGETKEQRIKRCNAIYVAALTKCEVIEGMYMTDKDFETCADNAFDAKEDCIANLTEQRPKSGGKTVIASDRFGDVAARILNRDQQH